MKEEQPLGGDHHQVAVLKQRDGDKRLAVLPWAKVAGAVESGLPGRLHRIIGRQPPVNRQRPRPANPPHRAAHFPGPRAIRRGGPRRGLPAAVPHGSRCTGGKVEHAHRRLRDRPQDALAQPAEHPSHRALRKSVVRLRNQRGDAANQPMGQP